MPTHPPTQGSRQRALDINRAFRRAGAIVTYLYWAAEGVDESALEDMRASWDDVIILRPDGFKEHRTHVPFFGIDDWYDERISEAVSSLCASRGIDVCVANYVWMSKALTALPPSCVRVIDTHDLFGGRAEHFYAIGRSPEWFYTSVDEESIGLNRADLVIAIQDREAEQIAARTQSKVMTVGFLNTPSIPTKQARQPGPIRVGYIGSDNPLNLSSLLAFYAALKSHPTAGINFAAAGPICRILQGIVGQPFRLLGIVDNLSDFYSSVDLVINPMVGGTGLKIKTIEALANRVGVIGTQDAFAGIASSFDAHRCRDPIAVAQTLVQLGREPEMLNALQEASQTVFTTYIGTQRDAFADLYAEISQLAARKTRPAHQSMHPKSSIAALENP